MNLIFLTMDGARTDRIVNGENYSKIIQKSAFFPKTITYAPFTIAAMHAVFSGTYGFKTGVNSYWTSPNFKKNEYKTIPQYLKDNGYLTFGDTINKLVLPKAGFDELEIHDELNDDLTIRHKSLLDKMKLLDDEGKKIFIYLHYSNIHTGIMQNVLKKFDNFSEEYFSSKDKNSQYYDTLFQEGDKYLRNIINHIEKLGLDKNSLLIIMSDHGIGIGEKIGERAYGVFCYDYTLVSTVLFSYPKLTPIKINNQIRSIDILPTILDILNIPQDPKYCKMDGESLLSIINGKIESRIAFSQSGNPLNSAKPPKEPNVYAVRTDEWKYIKNIHNSSEELYHLISDPAEEKNLIEIEDKIADLMRLKMNKILNS